MSTLPTITVVGSLPFISLTNWVVNVYTGPLFWGGINGFDCAWAWPLLGMFHECDVLKCCDKGKFMSKRKPFMKSMFPVTINTGCNRPSNVGTFFGADGAESNYS